MTLRVSLLLGLCAALSGCAGLLPRSEAVDVSPFDGYERARSAFERIEPYTSTLDDMKALGFNGDANPNVRHIPYPQLLARLALTPQVPFEELDVGIRDCIVARQACRAFEFRFGRINQERRGGFFGDFLNFRRITHTDGWRFEGLVLVRDSLVLFRNHGGEPLIRAREERVNPLGPFQSMGEAAARGVVRD